MDVASFSQLLTSVGFPIACCIFMGWYIARLTDQYREDINQMNEKHKAESDRMTEALNNNTNALSHLTMLLAEKGLIDDGK